MNRPELDLNACDSEPIHIPGSIQPHGIMLVADSETMKVTHAAGEVEAWLGRDDWSGASLAELGGAAVAAACAAALRLGQGAARRVWTPGGNGPFDVSVHVSGGRLIAEFERAGDDEMSSSLLPQLEAASAAFERCIGLPDLCEAAAVEFRRLTGYERIMIYRFLEDDAGVVVAEDAAPGQHSFLHHHFPATDIPRQARALYVRNLIRVIPDAGYRPAPLRPGWTAPEPLDMSDSVLRSVSPVHLQYLRNMGVAASASVSIVKDGMLWGLVACHSGEPKTIPAEVRAACRALAGALARQIKSREETNAYRERVRLRSSEDDIVSLLLREGSLDDAISNHLDEIRRMLDADGVAVLRGSDLVSEGRVPRAKSIRSIAAWAADKAAETVYATDMLGGEFEVEAEDAAPASGLLAITLSASDPWVVLWFRAEQVEVVEWAGNPHKSATAGPDGQLTPRASFEAWSETVRGRSRPWTIPELEAAGRLRTAVMGVWQTRRIHELNRQLLNTLDQKDLLIREKEFLIGEVNHRVQNSLTLVSSFLGLQARFSDQPEVISAIEEARRRIGAVSLVHRRLYRADQLEVIDGARYIDELLDDLVSSMGEEWSRQVARDLEPIMLPADRAVGIGLILTELVINAIKYAYGGGAGPLRIALAQDRGSFRLAVEDEGAGRVGARKGFGSRMMEAMVGQLGGELSYDGKPGSGTCAVLTAPIERRKR